MRRSIKNSLFVLLVSCISGFIQVSCESSDRQNANASVTQQKREPKAEAKSNRNSVTPVSEKKSVVGDKQEAKTDKAQNDRDPQLDDQDQQSEEPQDYAVGWDAERSELRRNVKEEIEAIEAKIEELKDDINGAGPDVRTRYQRAIGELKFERAKLSSELKRLSTAKKDNWEKVKSKVSYAIQASDERVGQVADQVGR